MLLYHYTSLVQLQSILADKEIHLTASNLLKPIAPHYIRLPSGIKSFVDETDSYKPVVWFTSSPDFDTAINCGLGKRKTEAAIVVNSTSQEFEKWVYWAELNRIQRSWFNSLKRAAPLYETFYITEQPVPITDETRIVYRPDIQGGCCE